MILGDEFVPVLGFGSFCRARTTQIAAHYCNNHSIQLLPPRRPRRRRRPWRRRWPVCRAALPAPRRRQSRPPSPLPPAATPTPAAPRPTAAGGATALVENEVLYERKTLGAQPHPGRGLLGQPQVEATRHPCHCREYSQSCSSPQTCLVVLPLECFVSWLEANGLPDCTSG